MVAGRPSAEGSNGNRLRLLGAVAALVLVAVALILAIVGGEGEGGAAASLERPAQLVQPADLTTVAGEVGHQIYWAGKRPGLKIELSVEAGNDVYLRYLTRGATAGDRRQSFLTVGTYPVPDAAGALRHTAAEAGTSVERLGGGGVALPNPSSIGSVYLAYPGSDLEIEVYDPVPGRALRLIRAGQVVPAGD